MNIEGGYKKWNRILIRHHILQNNMGLSMKSTACAEVYQNMLKISSTVIL